MFRTRSARPFACVVLALSASAFGAGPDGKGDDNRKPSYAIDPAAKAFVDRFERTELLKDEVFIKALTELARSKLSPEARADAFALMQERIGWLFVGAARLFPKNSYAQTTSLILTTYFQYQEKTPAGLEVGPLLELARTTRDRHPLRASNALLLATILNHRAARDAVRKAIDAQAIAKAPVPAIDLHNLSRAAALTRDPAVVHELVDLLPGIQSEESREDVIAVTAIFADDKLRDQVEQFVRRAFPASFDNSLQTALIVLFHAGPQEHFRTFYKSLGDLTKDKKDIQKLRDFWDSGFGRRDRAAEAKGSMLKLWDGFTCSLQKDGGIITDGKSFRCWIGFK